MSITTPDAPASPKKQRDSRLALPTKSDHVRGGSYKRRESALGLALVLPATIVFAVFSFYPFFKNFYEILYVPSININNPAKFVGLTQFWDTISSSSFLDSLRSTAIFVVCSVPLGVLGGIFLAVLAHQKLRGIAFFRTAFSSTIVSSAAVAGAVFGVLLNPADGFLPWLGIHFSPNILESPTLALPAVALISSWQFVGLSFIIMIAGMQSLPEEVLEAASMDGASSWTKTWRVTMPLLSPSIFFASVVGVIFSLQSLGVIDVTIGPYGAPYTHTNVLIYAIYNQFVQYNNPGSAACYAFVLFVITLIVTLVQFRLVEKRVHYGQ